VLSFADIAVQSSDLTYLADQSVRFTTLHQKHIIRIGSTLAQEQYVKGESTNHSTTTSILSSRADRSLIEAKCFP